MNSNDFPYRRALITGGAGFIGSHLAEALLGLGVEVHTVDNYLSGKPGNLSGMSPPNLLHQHRVDVGDVHRLESVIRQVEVIFHLAASKKNTCLADPRRDLQINAGGALAVLMLAQKHQIKKVVLASTGSVYGEAQYFPQDEAHPLAPVSYYGVSKLAGEQYGRVFHHLHGLPVVILRYFHVYGPRQDASDDRGGVVGIFCRRALAGLPLVIYGDGDQQRSFTYVEDVVKANLLAAADPAAVGEPYNCASGLKITVMELAQQVLKHAGRPDLHIDFQPWSSGDIRRFEIDNRKIAQLGMTAWTPFAEGLKKTMDWYRRAR